MAVGGQVLWPDAASAAATSGAAAPERALGAAAGAPAAAPDQGGTTRDAAASSASQDPRPLLQLVNGNGVPLYTLSRSEADTAVARHGFRLLPNTLGYLWDAAFAGSQPIYRLKSLDGRGWLYTASVSERDSLVGSRRFVYEGVAGHTATQKAPGTVMLSRYSGPKGWRIAVAPPGGGFQLDGPLGYVHPRWNRVGALYFGTWNSGANPAILRGGRTFYGRTYDDWWAGVRDYSGQDPSVPHYTGEWPSADFSDRKPSIGFYDDAQTATVEKHITQASSSGLDYFAFYWYWNPTTQQEHAGAGLQSFLRAGNRGALDFGLTVCAHPWDNGRLKIPTDQYGTVADRLVDRYLSQSDYMRANDGRKILWLCDTKGIGSGSNADIKRFVDTVRARARSVLGEEMLVLSHQDLGLNLGAVGADGNYCASPYGATQAGGYADYVRNQRANFARGAPTFVRCIMADFDERPRYPITVPNASSVRFFPDQDFAKFAQAARNVQADIGESTRTSVVDNFVLVYAWNEWHEGGHIEPNVRDGCRYLDILRSELTLRQGTGCVAEPG